MVVLNYFCLRIVVSCHLRDFQLLHLYGMCHSQDFLGFFTFFFFDKEVGENGGSFVLIPFVCGRIL